MSEWLANVHGFFLEQQPFVVATISRYEGSSPGIPGAGLITSADKTHRFASSESSDSECPGSDQRFEAMLAEARSLLAEAHSAHAPDFRTSQLPLGQVAGTDNGYCDVIYEFFNAIDYPAWLTQLIQNQQRNKDCFLLREIETSQSYSVQQTGIKTTVLSNDELLNDKRLAGVSGQSITCATISNGDSLLFLRAIVNRDIVINIIGNHPVATEISKQTGFLPVALNWLRDLQPPITTALTDTMTGNVIIMTTDHELDYQLCELALTHSYSEHGPATNTKFVGCIGSAKKAAIFKARLLQSGLSESQVESLHMPIGLEQISGKQQSVIAASIVAQILALHQW